MFQIDISPIFMQGFNWPWEVAYNVIFPISSNFSVVSTLLIKIEILCFTKRKLSSLMFFCCVCMWKTFPALCYIICGSAGGHSFKPIILLHISFCPINFCSSKILSVSDLPSKIHSLQHKTKTVTDFVDTAYNVGSFLRQTKLVSSFIKGIHKKKLFCDICLDKLILFQNHKIYYLSWYHSK